MQKAISIIGSRKTPFSYLAQIEDLSYELATKYWIRTGGAVGADQAAMAGARTKCLVYLPWKGYESKTVLDTDVIPVLESPSTQAILMAESIHPNWNACSPGARLLHARNSHIIMGKNLDAPAEFVICYSEIEALNGEYLEKGGTRLGCDIARKNSIPVYNVKIYNPAEILKFIEEKTNYKFES